MKYRVHFAARIKGALGIFESCMEIVESDAPLHKLEMVIREKLAEKYDHVSLRLVEEA